MSEKQKEKVTPEEYIKANTINDFYPDSEWVDPKHAIKAVALARKEGEERMKKMAEAYEIYRFRTIESGNKPDNIVTWIKSYLPEKGDNNDKA